MIVREMPQQRIITAKESASFIRKGRRSVSASTHIRVAPKANGSRQAKKRKDRKERIFIRLVRLWEAARFVMSFTPVSSIED